MSDPPNIPAPQYTVLETISILLAAFERCTAEHRALELMPGPQGEKGERGEQGKPGPVGDRGAKGEAGRNAADLALLQEYIDQRIERMIDGASVTTLDGGRTLDWSFGGKVFHVKTAVVLDTGVWKEGSAYSQGDGVTFGGNFFIAKVDDTTTKPPADQWRLAIRAGRDGKDHRPDEKRVPEPVRFK